MTRRVLAGIVAVAIVFFIVRLMTKRANAMAEERMEQLLHAQTEMQGGCPPWQKPWRRGNRN